VPPDSVRCTRTLEVELFTFRNFQGRSAIIHWIVRCASGATASSAPTVTCRGIYCAPERAEVRHAREGAPDSLQDLSGAPPDSQAGPQDIAPTVEPQRSATWLAHRTVSVGAPDCLVRHATAAFQRPLCGGWGYKYPQPPHIHGHLSFPTSTPYKSYNIQYKTHQSDQILSQFHTKL
jgi:hypothetical protein